ncbi:hypothetical protein E2C01_095899 [Portunus trituberculatus]|uniref:Uncharacterized protein n=1 Tax=Portunus trituberculatus TaxID=210409 RepID=A0A5B7K583_PORTR|nr:hypothetical protein [Portunus trituberculatus]
MVEGWWMDRGSEKGPIATNKRLEVIEADPSRNSISKQTAVAAADKHHGVPPPSLLLVSWETLTSFHPFIFLSHSFSGCRRPFCPWSEWPTSSSSVRGELVRPFVRSSTAEGVGDEDEAGVVANSDTKHVKVSESIHRILSCQVVRY